MAKELTSENFDDVIKNNPVVFVDFWASWCGPCKQMEPIVDALSEEMDDVVVGKVNIEEDRDLAQTFGVMSIPTFIVFKEGEVVEKFAGSMSKEALKTQLGKHV